MREWRIDRLVLMDGMSHSGWLPPSAVEPRRTSPRSVRVWIVQEQEASFYLYTDDQNEVFDSWHLTFEDAAAQAQFTYGILKEEWSAVLAQPD
jgi:hypothetical protein